MRSAEPDAHRPLVALTGATGFLGSHIADLLLERGYPVRAAVRPTSDLRWLRGKPIEIQQVTLAPVTAGGTATDRTGQEVCRSVEEFVAGAAAIIHCAGVTKASQEEVYQLANVATTASLLAAARAAGVCHTFILISSLAAAGPAPASDPRREDAVCEPISAYGRSKLAAEVHLQASDLPFRTVILRPPALYGPRDRDFLPLFRLAQSGWTARLGRRLQSLSLVDGRDAARGAVALLESDSTTGPYFIDDGHSYSWSDLATALGEACGRRVRTFTVPTCLLQAAARMVGPHLAERSSLLNKGRLADISVPGWVCSGEKLRRETGFAPQWGLNRGFWETMDFYLSNGWLA